MVITSLKNSARPDLAGQSVPWHSDDKESRFAENSKKNKKKLEATGLANKEFEYKFNSSGFRSPEFTDSGTDILFVGCSLTVGVGLPEENTWPYIVANELGCTWANIGMSAGAADTCFRFSNFWIPKIKPAKVVYLEPPPGRFEILKDNIHFENDVILSAHDDHEINYLWQATPQNTKLNYLKNKLGIKSIAEAHGSDFFYFHYLEIHHDRQARDLGHPGIAANANFAKIVVDKISKSV